MRGERREKGERRKEGWGKEGRRMNGERREIMRGRSKDKRRKEEGEE